jgi:hypothetical protein
MLASVGAVDVGEEEEEDEKGSSLSSQLRMAGARIWRPCEKGREKEGMVGRETALGRGTAAATATAVVAVVAAVGRGAGVGVAWIYANELES